MYYKGTKREGEIHDNDFLGYGDKIREALKERILFFEEGALSRSTENEIRVLDIGTGYGKTIELLTSIPFSKPTKISTIDPSNEILERAKKILREKHLDENVEFVQTGVEKLDYFQSDYFDLIVSVMVLHHIVSLRPALEEINRVAKKGSKVILLDWKREAHVLPFTTGGHKYEDLFGLNEITEQITGLDLRLDFSQELDYWYIGEFSKS
jgi:ubiquinone/menaquinone biosynthesis C-methylase UbiE